MITQGDIFYVDFNPSMGHEQKNRRPAIALSNDLVAKYSGMTIVAPISSTTRNFPMYMSLPINLPVHGKVLLDQTTALDLESRHVPENDIVGHLTNTELTEILNRYKLLFDID